MIELQSSKQSQELNIDAVRSVETVRTFSMQWYANNVQILRFGCPAIRKIVTTTVSFHILIVVTYVACKVAHSGMQIPFDLICIPAHNSGGCISQSTAASSRLQSSSFDCKKKLGKNSTENIYTNRSICVPRQFHCNKCTEKNRKKINSLLR